MSNGGFGLVPVGMLKSVAKLTACAVRPGDTVQGTATIFDIGDAAQPHIIAVTCAHCVQSDPENRARTIELMLRKPEDDGIGERYWKVRSQGEDWKVHPEWEKEIRRDHADIAVLHLTEIVPKEVPTWPPVRWQLERKNLRTQIQKDALWEGTGTVTFGFPSRPLLGQYSWETNEPVARRGAMALVQPWLEGYSKVMLVDGGFHPGQSGSPVYTWEYRTEPKSGYAVIGIASARLEETGMGVITPRDEIWKTIQNGISNR